MNFGNGDLGPHESELTCEGVVVGQFILVQVFQNLLPFTFNFYYKTESLQQINNKISS